jgi:hypothetical protein
MRYITWYLTWPTAEYGYGPEQTAADNGAHLEASMWVNPDVEHGNILGYLTGDLNLALLADWDVTELSEAEALAFAVNLDAGAYVMADGIIGTTTVLTVRPRING